MTSKYYWEDFPVGDKRHAGPVVVSAEEIIDFAKKFDPQDFHIDAALAKDSRFGTLIASGWHVCALAMRLICDGFLLESAGLGSPGVDKVRWKQPVRPGDALSLDALVLEARRSESRPEVGLVRWHWDITNQLGQSVAELETMGMVRCRDAI